MTQWRDDDTTIRIALFCFFIVKSRRHLGSPCTRTLQLYNGYDCLRYHETNKRLMQHNRADAHTIPMSDVGDAIRKKLQRP
eukprot:9478853-Pyramimonas_sp.AAC.1